MIDWRAARRRKEMDIKWPSESAAAALRANYQSNGVNARDEMGSADERDERGRRWKRDTDTAADGDD